MKFTALTIALMGALAAASDVVKLDSDNFADFVSDNKLVLAEFFAPWCGHCKQLAPEYETAATILKEKGIPIGKVDCTENEELCSKFEIQGYPTLKIFRGSEEDNSLYQSARTSEAIVQYLLKQALPLVSEFASEKELKAFTKENDVTIVAFHDADDEKSESTFQRVAQKLRERFTFGHSADKALAKKHGVEKFPALVVYRNFDEKPAVYDISAGKKVFKFKPEPLTKFIKTEAVPVIGEIGPASFQDYATSGLPLVYIFSAAEKDTKQISDWVKPWAEKLKGEAYVGVIDAELYGSHAQNVNIQEKFPAIAIENFDNKKKWAHSQDAKITKATVDKFFKEYIDGTLEPILKSDPVPEYQDGPVHIVVGKNYKDIVLDDEKDVLIEFYAPWCGHCKTLAPIYDELGDLFFDHPEISKKVTVAKIDATTNEFPDEDVKGFPTIKLYPAGKKNAPITYPGARTLEGLNQFIKEHGTHQVDGLAHADEEEETPVKDTKAKKAGKIDDEL